MLPNFQTIQVVLAVFLIGLGAACAVFFALRARRRRSGEEGGALAEQQLRSILRNLEDAVIVYDKDFTVKFFNPAAERLFGLGAAAVVGHASSPQDVEAPGWRFFTQVMFPSIAPTVVSRTPAGEYPQVLEISFAEPFYELRVSTLPLGGERGELHSFMKVVRDRTREASLLRSKSEFLTIAAHQLRTPATEVLWAMESLAQGELGVEMRRVVETVLQSAKTLAKMIEDLLNVTRIEEGRFGYHFEAVDVVEVAKKVVENITFLAQQLGITIYFEKPKGILPKAIADVQKISLALNNMIENAIRYNIEHGEVQVSVEQMPNRPFVEIRVRDTGIGISPVDLGNLFKKFFRSREAMKAYTGGTGLGLYIAKNIVQAHGGQVWVESEQGRGSTFHFSIATDPSLVPGYEKASE